MIVQRLVNRRGLAIDREPQPGDLRDDVGLSVDPQSRIVSPRPTRVKVGRRRVTQGSMRGRRQDRVPGLPRPTKPGKNIVLRVGRDDAPLGASSRSLDPDNVQRSGQSADNRLAKARSEVPPDNKPISRSRSAGALLHRTGGRRASVLSEVPAEEQRNGGSRRKQQGDGRNDPQASQRPQPSRPAWA
jgi:hypothetical protein